MKDEDTVIITDVATGLAEALGLDTPAQPIVKAPKPLISRPVASKDQIEDDANYARENIYGIIEQGAQALEVATGVVKETLHPRAIETLAQLLKVQSDNVDKLLKLHADKKKLNSIDEGTNSGNGMTVEKAIIFQGTSEDLIRHIRHEAKTTPYIDADVDTSEETNG